MRLWGPLRLRHRQQTPGLVEWTAGPSQDTWVLRGTPTPADLLMKHHDQGMPVEDIAEHYGAGRSLGRGAGRVRGGAPRWCPRRRAEGGTLDHLTDVGPRDAGPPSRSFGFGGAPLQNPATSLSRDERDLKVRNRSSHRTDLSGAEIVGLLRGLKEAAAMWRPHTRRRPGTDEHALRQPLGYLLVAFLLHTGCRKMEAQIAQVDDIHASG